jgi:MFS family permease
MTMTVGTIHENDYDPRRWAMFAVLLVGAFLPPLDFFIVNVALPSIRAELETGPAAQQLVISVYATVYAATLITGGRFGDLYGRSRIFFIGLVGFAAASALCGLAQSPLVLIVGRALQGLTAAAMAPQGLASVQAIFPEAEKPRALSLYGAVLGLAAVVGQPLGGILIGFDVLGLGWRVIFLVNLPVVALVLLFGLPLLRNTRAEKPRRPDFIGVLLSVLTLGCVVVPLIEGREAGWPVWTWVTLVAAPLLAILFWRYEIRLAARGGDPLVDPASLGAPGLRLGLVVALLLYASAAFFLLLSVYLQGALGESALDAGLIFLPFGLGFLLGTLLTPGTGRIFGSFVNPIGMGLGALGFVVLALLVSYTPAGIYPQRWLMAFALFASGFGLGLALPTLVRAVIGRVIPAFAGMIAGIVISTLQVSAALSVAVIGDIYFTVLGRRVDPASIAHAFVVAMLCMAVCLAVATVLGVILALRPAGVPVNPASPVRRSVGTSCTQEGCLPRLLNQLH